MCGIFGYIGTRKNAAQLVFTGLKTLEYRGYDSWGIAVKVENGKLKVKKHIGKIPKRNPNSQFSIFNSHLGIGHTRWATHGEVTVSNSHPHADCTKQIAVLHNGIVENFQELKEQLQKGGHKFISQTDTEVIAHLLEDSIKKHSFVEALRNTFIKLKGLNAIVAINSTSQEIVAAKSGSPLIVGIGKNELLLASDVAGILPYTKRVIFLKDNELVKLGTSLEVFTLPSGEKIKPKIDTITWKIEEASKGAYKHFMLKEIMEQPRIIRALAQNYTEQVNKIASLIKKAKGTFFIGSGTAFHACLAGTYLFADIAKRHVNTAPASEFNYLEDFLTDESLIIPLSQSGETIDVIEPLIRAKRKKSKIISLVNVPGSTIYRMGDYKLLLGAGPETAVASTKAYIAKIALLTLVAYALSEKQKEAKDILQETAVEAKRLLRNSTQKNLKSLAKKLYQKEHIYIIGRGVSYATALEGALKIKEVSYIHTEGLAGGELKHGTIALIEKGTPCIVLAPQDRTYDAILSNATEIKARGGMIIGVSSKPHPVFDEWIEVRETGSPLIAQVIPLQLLAYYLAIDKKLDPDKPRNLAKSVTVK